jgi:hypothetical protein
MLDREGGTRMLFGDARQSLTQIGQALKTA